MDSHNNLLHNLSNSDLTLEEDTNSIINTSSNNNTTEEGHLKNDEENAGSNTEEEAMQLLKQQHNHIKILKEKVAQQKIQIKNYRKKLALISKKDNILLDNTILCDNLKEQNKIIKNENEELKLKVYSQDKLIGELKSEIENLVLKYNNISKNIDVESDKSNKINQLVEIIKGYATEIKKSNDKIEIFKGEVFNLNENLSKQMRVNQELELKLKDKNDNKWEVVNKTKQDIILLSQWIENYLGLYFDKNVTIPDLPRFNNLLSYDNDYKGCMYDLLCDTIENTRKKVYKTQLNYEEQITALKKGQLDLIDKFNKINLQHRDE